jgi:ubiquinone/menaquinone biosynthesis C-methylase UbiE
MDERRIFFDSTADDWDTDKTNRRNEHVFHDVVDWFEIEQGYVVLDVGTGTGVLLSSIEDKVGKRGRVIGMDFSYKMLEKARKWIFYGSVSLCNGAVSAMPIKSDSIDRVTCFSAFPHFPDKHKALVEMFRVLKPGGVLFIAHLHSFEEINQLHNSVGGVVKTDHLPDPEEMESLMKYCGLSEVLVKNEPGKYLAKGKKG